LLNKATFDQANDGMLSEKKGALEEKQALEFEQDTLNFPIRVANEEMLIQQHD